MLQFLYKPAGDALKLFTQFILNTDVYKIVTITESQIKSAPSYHEYRIGKPLVIPVPIKLCGYDIS